MYASKVSFSNQTRALINARPLSRNKRVKLRQQRVMDFIRETPNGEVRKRDLIEAAGFNPHNEREYARGWAIIGTMIRKKMIVASDGSNPKNSYLKQWTIPGDVVTRPDAVPHPAPAEEVEQKAEEVPTETTGKMYGISIEQYAPDDIREKAKEFAWRENSDSLREFIAWLEKS